ncbi:hypothetical protein [Salinarimonas soli]|uniref:2'-5' RNA ligase family protein n=1 Tax=Salinarimonas soli TaxID=1638099 RepID=A0A5B2VDT7_9HYPH|nr:hypothetical protein [Salinarimonas soli]KAA2237114.1 hypothetical protein F0L46_11675 [Salinarimonas soli]
MTDFCHDDELAYRRSRTPSSPGEGLALDEPYRLAHLPLVAPAHPDVIAAKPGRSYDMGRHERIFSLVLPVPHEALAASEGYQALEAELRAAPFAHKLAWDILPRRAAKLHATICGSLSRDTPPVIGDAARRALAAIGPVTVELRGLFSGNVNVGRLYLRAYPERRAGRNAFHALQEAMGRPTTDLYVMGLHNLVDHLDAHEAAALGTLIERWWDRPILRWTAGSLWVLGASDDLVLDGRVVEEIALG